MVKRRILVPIDYSHSSERALNHALAMVEADDSKVTFLHVGTLPMYVSPSLAITLAGSRDTTTLERLTIEEASSGMKAFLHSAKVPEHLRDQVEVTIGDPTTVILNRLDDYDLAVLGTHGRRGVDHLFVGSVAEKVLRQATKPVITVHGGADRAITYPPRKVLVPMDFSTGARKAYEFAMQLFREHGSEIQLLHVLERFTAFEGFEPLGAVQALSGEKETKSYEEYAREAVSKEFEVFLRDSIDSSERNLEILSGSPHLQITEHAENGGFDLIAMGTHGRSGWSRIGIGSVAERVVRVSEVPVLTIRATE